MIVLSEHDLAIKCEVQRCTGVAVYIVTVHAHETLYRLYCPQCTAELLQRLVMVLVANADERPLHEYVETELLFKGGVVNA